MTPHPCRVDLFLQSNRCLMIQYSLHLICLFLNQKVKHFALDLPLTFLHQKKFEALHSVNFSSARAYLLYSQNHLTPLAKCRDVIYG